ncbi:5-methylcytosine-specific restriction enzyme A [Candidatus Liberibacter solanacearum]|uniref:HNH endonuclease family protein n=1 Tax=Candidatus Liberibacter solanacearum TaxID=556287 RepID=UPI0038712238
MDIQLTEITIRDLFDSYTDNEEKGVLGYGKKLDIRPPYQREFIYKDEQREAVIDTIINSFPLNIMYWAKKEDGKFELMDGQQRTIAICQYLNNIFSYKSLYYYNQQKDIKEKILNYKLMIYICEGTDSAKLNWFKTINTAGEKLTDQELRNAIYSGNWVTDAKRYFSKKNCVAYQKGHRYLKGSPIRQDYLETVIRWISDDGKIEDYMGKHQHHRQALPLWEYFEKVINWVECTFTKYRKEMEGIEWGLLYNQFKDDKLNPKEIENKINKLMLDDEVTNNKGIYKYILTGEEKHLNLRSFTESQRRKAYEEQKGICSMCKKKFSLDRMEADHRDPWHEGGKTSDENCQMLCKTCNRQKSGK